jgi:glycosyltransferase involved in cell wall biosynthesis
MKIIFVDSGPLAYNGTTLITHSLGGTESSLIFLSEELAKEHEVFVINGCASEQTYKNVKYLPRDKFYGNEAWWKEQDPDIIVGLTAPYYSQFWKRWCPRSKLFLWVHLYSGQPATKDLGDPNKMSHVDMVVGVSDWHCDNLKESYSLEKVTYVKNAISEHFQNLFESADDLLKKKQLKACYTSAPYRGLDVLIHAIPYFQKQLKFDIFSSMKLYQMEDDQEFEKYYLYARSFDGVSYKGLLNQKNLAKEITSSAFFTYPCTMEETFCLSLLESMAAGCKPIISNIGALDSTARGLGHVVSFDKAAHIEIFMHDFIKAVKEEMNEYKKDPIAWSERQYDQVKYINDNDTWAHRAKDWNKLFNEVKSQ